jgi:hypothetical protein
MHYRSISLGTTHLLNLPHNFRNDNDGGMEMVFSRIIVKDGFNDH